LGRLEVPRRDGVVSWRFWEIAETDDGWRLRSPYWSSSWLPGEEFRGECLVVDRALRVASQPHEAPGDACRCGVYGGTYGQLQSFLRANVARRAAVPVIGQVLLWGTVVPAQGGWRASHAYPLQLSVSTLSRRAYDVAAGLEAYDVPVDLLDAGATFTAVYAPREAERHLAPLPDRGPS